MNDHRVFIFFRRQNPNAVSQAEKMDQHLVGINIQLLLTLTLHIDFAVLTKNVRQPGTTNFVLNHLGRHRDSRQQR